MLQCNTKKQPATIQYYYTILNDSGTLYTGIISDKTPDGSLSSKHPYLIIRQGTTEYAFIQV